MGKLVATIVFIAVGVVAVVTYCVGIVDKTATADDLTLTSIDQRSRLGKGFSALSHTELGKTANPDYVMSFPNDHFSHDAFDIEWWYLTANMHDEQDNQYGLQWTLFRFRNPSVNTNSQSNWHDKHIYMAHASVHSKTQHWFSEKFARGNVGNAGTEKSPFTLFIDDWIWVNNEAAFADDDKVQQGLLPAQLSFNVRLINASNQADHPLDLKKRMLNVKLSLRNTGPYVLQGEKGYSIKSADGRYASHYYSAPFIEVAGELSFTVNGNTTNTLIKGNAWFDHEWTSQLVDNKTLGWDWLSLHLDNGDKVMAFRMRIDGQQNYVTGSYIESNGIVKSLKPNDLTLQPGKQTAVGNKQLPLDWILEIPSKGISLNIRSSKEDQWNPAMVSYYEGSVEISGTQTGVGFLELTGY
jgi:predicted secreted hydrolase